MSDRATHTSSVNTPVSFSDKPNGWTKDSLLARNDWAPHHRPADKRSKDDPTSANVTNTASLNTPRQGHASALLQNRQVLAAGGYESQLGSRLGYLASAELFD